MYLYVPAEGRRRSYDDPRNGCDLSRTPKAASPAYRAIGPKGPSHLFI